MLAVGSDPVGDVQIVPDGAEPIRATARLSVGSFEPADLAEVSFSEVLATYDIHLDHVTGNGDAHAKNFSVVADDTGRWRPAPAYDVPSTHPCGDTTLALSIDGRRDGNITGARFIALGEALGLPERAATRVI